MAKNPQESSESINANDSELNSESNPYLNEEVSTKSRFGWIKSKPAKITAISVGGALALGAVFAGGAIAGQAVSHNNGPAIGEPFGNDNSGSGEFGGKGKFGPGDERSFNDQGGKFGPDGDRGFAGPDGQTGKHAPRPPHDFDGDGPADQNPELDSTETPAT